MQLGRAYSELYINNTKYVLRVSHCNHRYLPSLLMVTILFCFMRETAPEI